MKTDFRIIFLIPLLLHIMQNSAFAQINNYPYRLAKPGYKLNTKMNINRNVTVRVQTHDHQIVVGVLIEPPGDSIKLWMSNDIFDGSLLKKYGYSIAMNNVKRIFIHDDLY